MTDKPTPPDFAVSATKNIGHSINTYQTCPKCGGTNFGVRNHSLIWHDGDVWCADCNVFVRDY